MQLNLKKTTLYAVFLFALALLVGCGGRNSNNVYRIARDESWYPLQLVGKERNMVAFTNELFNLIGRDEGFQTEFTQVAYGNMLGVVDRGKAIGALSTTSPTPRMKDYYFFSEPIYLVGPVIIVPIDSSIRNLTDLDDKVIGIRSGSPLAFEAKKYPTAIITSYDSAIAGLEDLEEGRIDAMVLDALPAYIYTQGFYTGRLKVATTPLTNEGIRLTTIKTPEASKLIDQFNEGLAKLRASGAYDALLIKWGLINPELRQKKTPE